MSKECIHFFGPLCILHLQAYTKLSTGLFSCKQITLIQSNTPQVYFNSVGNPYMRATCFGL